MRASPSIEQRVLCAIAFALAVSTASWTTGEALPARAIVTGISGYQVGDETQITITATKPVTYQLRDVRTDWIVIDIPGAELRRPPESVPVVRVLVKKVRVGQFMPDIVRVVVELIQPAEFHLSSSPDRAAIVLGISLATGGRPVPRAQAVVPSIAGPQTETPTARPDGQTNHAQLTLPRVTSGPRLPAQIRAIAPGQHLGLVRLGMGVQDLRAVLGSSGGEQRMADGSVVYQWYRPPANVGLGARVGADNAVFRIWVLNDPSYATTERLHAGSTEAEVRAALGQPSQTFTNVEQGLKTLRYDALGVWFSIQLVERYAFYKRVFEIGVMRPR